MAERAKRDGVLGKQTKEFIALGMAVSARCDSCIGFHVRALVNLKTTLAEMVDALTMIAYMGGGPAVTYSAKALEAFDEFSAQTFPTTKAVSPCATGQPAPNNGRGAQRGRRPSPADNPRTPDRGTI